MVSLKGNSADMCLQNKTYFSQQNQYYHKCKPKKLHNYASDGGKCTKQLRKNKNKQRIQHSKKQKNLQQTQKKTTDNRKNNLTARFNLQNKLSIPDILFSINICGQNCPHVFHMKMIVLSFMWAFEPFTEP